jgi:hypothetical protein
MERERVSINNFGIPPLGGVCSYEEACNPGYSVEHNVNLLRRYNFIETRLNQIAAAHLTHTPEWEVKCALSYHLWLDSQHSAALRARVAEMREPPLHLDQIPDPKLGALLDEAIRAGNTVELLVGLYQVIKPEMARALHKHLLETNPLIDQPTCRILKLNLQEEEEMIAWGRQAIAALTQTPQAAEQARAWELHLRAFLEAAGGIPGDLEMPKDGALPQPRSDGQPYEMDIVPQRDERFVDNYNHAALIDTYYADESLPVDERGYALYFKRLREMDVPEWMAPIIYKTGGKTWDYYADISRQLWDEARHAMMGEVGLYQAGVPFYTYPVTWTASLSLNTEYTPFESHLILWGIEQSLMPRETGKRYEWELTRKGNDPLLTTFQDYDWADEVLHVHIGRRWLAPEFDNLGQLRDAALEAMKRWEVSESRYSDRSEQVNWWQDFLADVRERRQKIADA